MAGKLCFIRYDQDLVINSLYYLSKKKKSTKGWKKRNTKEAGKRLKDSKLHKNDSSDLYIYKKKFGIKTRIEKEIQNWSIRKEKFG